MAEETGLIIPLGRWILQEACRQGSAWLSLPNGPWRRNPDFTISVNLSSQQLEHPSLVTDVAAALESSRFPADRLLLEITESAIMANSEGNLAALHELKSLGVRLAIDDFGTGYSSLAYLQRFPVDVLKIDKSFVDGIARSATDATLARTIIALGDTLALRT